MQPSTRLLLARLSIALVFLWNIQRALVFLVWPERYATGFELSGVPGMAAVRGMGILFLMWNIPYAVALWHPIRYRVSLYEATAMQALALLGESLIMLSLPPGHSILRSSLLRFIAFDGAGLILLLLAMWLVHVYLRTPRMNHDKT